jgi:UDP-N-acetylglucosamine 2-epimerase (non-hydrolysing)
MQSKKLYIFIGTEAELIKLFPVLLELASRMVPYDILASGQNELSNSSIVKEFKLPKPKKTLSSGGIKNTPVSLFLWFIKTLFASYFSLRRVIVKGDLLILHGDTVSTVMGAVIGRLLGLTIIHIESGLRSFNLLSPFPEELDRLAVSRLAHYHFCPNSWAEQNLLGKKNVINTIENTLFDSLDLALKKTNPDQNANILFDTYGIFVMHRQENVYRRDFFTTVIGRLCEIAKTRNIVFVVHEPTLVALRSLNLLEKVKSTPNILLKKRMPYVELMHVMKRADFVITDGGSNQEECSYLGLPCLILRTNTERVEGLGENVLLMGDDIGKMDYFMNNIDSYRKQKKEHKHNPSKVIADKIQEILAENI